jgi:uncharacterized RDD family membrane protein YckC
VSGPELSPVPKEVRAYQGETAGVVTRSVANTIDALVVGTIVGACYLGLVSVKFLLDPRTFEWPEGKALLGLTFTLLMAVAYLWLSWWLLGRSYGKHIMGIRVAGRRGRKLGPIRALGRAAFCVFFPIGFFWCVISPRRHSIQDIAVYSAVTYDWRPHPGPVTKDPVPPDAVGAAPVAGPPVTPEERAPVPPVSSRRYRWARAVDPYDS